MLTRCPSCETIFRIREDQLTMANGLAHCYRCEQVFNARENILEESLTETPPQPSHPIEEPPFAPRDQHDDVETNEEEDQSAEAHQSTDVESTIEDIQKELDPEPLEPETETVTSTELATVPLSIEDLLATPTKKRSIFATLFWLLASITLLAAATAQLAWFEREKVISYPEGRMLLEKLCHYAHCQVPQQRDLSLITITQRQITSHPDNAEALLAQLTIKNQAPFSQPYPILTLSLSTTDGLLIARRSFSPAQYLPSSHNHALLMSPGFSQQIKLEIEDPGIGVTSFEFDFF